jgi:hemerythrin-like domain-containing protein
MTHHSREDYIYYARLAEQGERYEDMIRYMKEVSRVSSQTYIKNTSPHVSLPIINRTSGKTVEG